MAEFWRKYGTASKVRIPIVKASSSDFAVGADWTPASGDVKISKDGGAAASITTLPTAIAMGNGAIWEFAISATEMQAAEITITAVDSATKAVQDQAISILTFGNASAQLAPDFTDGVRAGLTALPNAAAAASGGLLTFGTSTGQLNPSSGDIKIQSNVKKNQALANFTFILTDSTNHNPSTGLTVTSTRSIDGGAFASTTNSVSEVSNGLYKLSLSAADLNGNVIDLRLTAASTDDLNIQFITDP
jgi:hypothetical protein